MSLYVCVLSNTLDIDAQISNGTRDLTKSLDLHLLLKLSIRKAKVMAIQNFLRAPINLCGPRRQLVQECIFWFTVYFFIVIVFMIKTK